MRPEQNAPSALRERASQQVQSPDLDVEATEPAVDEIHAVEDRRGKGEPMPPDIAEARGPPQGERKILARGAPSARRECEEVGANRNQQQAGETPPAAQSEPLHESRRAAAPALALLEPGRARRGVHLRAVRRGASLPAQTTVRTTSAKGRCS